MESNSVIRALDEHNGGLLAQLIVSGLDPNQSLEYRTCPLVVAILRQFTGGVHLLVKAGANVNLRTVEGYTPLGLAVQMGNYDVAELLLREGASPDAWCCDVALRKAVPREFAAVAGDQRMLDLLSRFQTIPEQND